jgi:hypothetical protein
MLKKEDKNMTREQLMDELSEIFQDEPDNYKFNYVLECADAYAEETMTQIRKTKEHNYTRIRGFNLKKCPCCGGKAEMNASKTSKGWNFAWVTCEECDMETAGYPTTDEAAAAWNRRTAEEVEQ